MSGDRITGSVRRYYAGRLAEHGATPKGVDWKDAGSQALRFEQLLAPWGGRPDASILDYGCGFGSLLGHLADDGWDGHYIGFDLSEEMVTEAERIHAGRPRAEFHTRRDALPDADIVLASGVLNVRLDHDVETWERYVLDVIDDLASLARVGFSFNCLTAHSDPEHMRPDLYYADPARLLDHCARRYSRHVRLAQDYPLYEFTLTVRWEI